MQEVDIRIDCKSDSHAVRALPRRQHFLPRRQRSRPLTYVRSLIRTSRSPCVLRVLGRRHRFLASPKNYYSYSPPLAPAVRSDAATWLRSLRAERTVMAQRPKRGPFGHAHEHRRTLYSIIPYFTTLHYTILYYTLRCSALLYSRTQTTPFRPSAVERGWPQPEF